MEAVCPQDVDMSSSLILGWPAIFRKTGQSHHLRGPSPMLWKQYAHQPLSRLLRSRPRPDSGRWLRLVEAAGLLRVSGDLPGPNGETAPGEVAIAFGPFFRPDVEPELTVLQVGGLLLRDGKLDADLCRLAARRYGGGLYFDWLLAQIDSRRPDPLPSKAFPLDCGRWRKRIAGRGQRNAQQRVHPAGLG